LIRQISLSNNEPYWMLEIRLKALKYFEEKAMPAY
jgi:Fe-S cluster assembly scaffold protein SufB